MLIAITGGRGMIGKAVVQELKRHNYDYRTLGRSPVPEEAQDRSKNLAGSITDPEIVEKLVAGAQCIFHLARSTHALDDLCEIDFYAMKVLLPVMLKNNLEVHFTSSQAVHGIEHGWPVKRVKEDHPFRPEDPYGVMKLAWERMLFVYKCRNHLRYITYRFPCVVPAEFGLDGWLTGGYWKQIQEKNSIEPTSDNERWGGRSYAHVEHIAATMVDNIGNKGAYGQEYMLCADDYLLNLDLAKLCRQVALENGIKCELQWPMKGLPGDKFQTQFNFNNNKARINLGFNLPDSKEFLLNKIRAWFKKFGNNREN